MSNGYVKLRLEHIVQNLPKMGVLFTPGPDKVTEIKNWNIETRMDIPSSVQIQDAMFEYFKVDADDYQFRLMKQKIADLESSNKFLEGENRRLNNEMARY